MSNLPGLGDLEKLAGEDLLIVEHGREVTRRNLVSNVRPKPLNVKQQMPTASGRLLVQSAVGWCDRVSALDIEMLCPQHGSIYRGKDVQRFIDWFRHLQVGVA